MFEKIKNGFITGFSFSAGVISMTLLAVTVGNVNTFNAGEPLSSSKLNENFSNVKTAIESLNTEVETLRTSLNTVNTELGMTKTDLSNTQTTLSTTNTNLQTLNTTLGTLESNVGLIIPTGTILASASTNVPNGWMLCDGRSLSRSTYEDLYTAIGTAYGSSDGNSFNIPDLRGRFIRGTDNSPDGFAVDPDRDSRIALYPNGKAGREIGSYQNDEFKNHRHNISNDGSAQQGGGKLQAWTNSDIGHMSGSTGGSETRPKNVYVNFIIKY